MRNRIGTAVLCLTALAGACAFDAIGADTNELLKQAASPYLEDRQAAVAELTKLPAAELARLVPELLTLIQSDERDAWFGQESAALVLQHLGERAKAAGPELKKCFERAFADKDWGLSNLLFETLVKVDPDAGKEIVPILVKHFEADNGQMARLALMMLQKSGAVGEAAVPTLIKAMTSKDQTVVEGALDALAGVGPKAEPAIPRLRELLKSTDGTIRTKALSALKGIGAPALPAMTAAFTDEDTTMVPAVVDALGEMKGVAEPAIPALVALSADADAALTQRITAALKAIKTGNEPPLIGPVNAACVEGHATVIALPVRDPDDVVADVQAEIVEEPAHGSLSRKDRITFVYQAKPGYIGADSFEWRATDGKVATPVVRAALEVVPDTDGPVVKDAVANPEGTEVRVVFDELVEPESAGKAANYALSDGAKVAEAALQPDGMTVLLKTADLPRGAVCTLTVKGVLDRSTARNAAASTAGVIRMGPGLHYDYYKKQFTDFPNYAELTPTESGTVPNFQLVNPSGQPVFALRYTGTITIPEDGEYTFYTQSDDGSRLFINGKQVVDNPGLHGIVEKSGKAKLEAGRYPIEVWFFDGGGGSGLRVLWEAPGIGKQDIPAGALHHRAE